MCAHPRHGHRCRDKAGVHMKKPKTSASLDYFEIGIEPSCTCLKLFSDKKGTERTVKPEVLFMGWFNSGRWLYLAQRISVWC